MGRFYFAFFGLLLGATFQAPLAEMKPKHVKGTVPIPKDFAKNPAPQGKAALPPSLHPLAEPRPSSSSVEQTLEGQTAHEQGAVLGRAGKTPLASCEAKHSIETFVQVSSAWGPQAAKTGGIYFLSDLREVPQVFYLNKPQAWPEQVTFLPDGVAYFRVSPNGEKLLVATHVGGDEQYDIYLLEPARRTVVPLIVGRKKRVESVAWAEDSTWFAYTSNERNGIDMDLYRYDLAQKKAALLAELSGWNAVSDVAPDGKKIALENVRSITDSDVLIWDDTEKKIENLTQSAGKSANRSPLFSQNSSGFFYLTDTPKGILQAYYLKLGRPAPGKPLITTSSFEVEHLSIDRARSRLAYLVNEDGYGRLSVIKVDANGGKKAELTLPQVGKGVARAPSFGMAAGGQSLFFSFSSSTRTSDIWEWKEPKLKAWSRSADGNLRTECLTQEELIRYPSFDGKLIPAFLYTPSPQATVPFILYAHGGPESQYRPQFGKTFQYFLERGYGVLAPNVRGSSGYGREYLEADNYKKRMDSVRDYLSAAKWLIEKRYTKTGLIAIYGGSYGGFVALRTIQEEPTLFAAASSSVGISDFVTFLKTTKPYRRALREMEYGPLTDSEFLKSISPMTHLDRIQTPLLLFHGANDPRVPASETDQIVSALKKRDVPVEAKIFSDEGHGNTKMRNIMEQAKTMVYFFEKHLKAK